MGYVGINANVKIANVQVGTLHYPNKTSMVSTYRQLFW